MGCGLSKIENEEAVTRCKERKLFMKEAVSARNAFAAAHSAYAMLLKNAGAALSDYAHGEVMQNPKFVEPTRSPVQLGSTGATRPPFETFVPPPPPLPNFGPVPLQRAASMPEFKPSKEEMKHAEAIIEEGEGEEMDGYEHESVVELKHREGAGVRGVAVGLLLWRRVRFKRRRRGILRHRLPSLLIPLGISSFLAWIICKGLI